MGSERRLGRPLALTCRRVAVLVLCAIVLACQTKDTLLESREGRFAVSMPGQPEEIQDIIETPGGQREMHLFSLSLMGEGPLAFLWARAWERPLAFSVSYVVLTETDRDLAKVISDAQDRLVDQLQAASREGNADLRIAATREMSGRYTGREILVEGARGKMWRVYLYVARDRCYKLQVFGTRRQVYSTHADRFFGSFIIRD